MYWSSNLFNPAMRSVTYTHVTHIICHRALSVFMSMQVKLYTIKCFPHIKLWVGGFNAPLLKG
jgi:hypothetical protein